MFVQITENSVQLSAGFTMLMRRRKTSHQHGVIVFWSPSATCSQRKRKEKNRQTLSSFSLTRANRALRSSSVLHNLRTVWLMPFFSTVLVHRHVFTVRDEHFSGLVRLAARGIATRKTIFISQFDRRSLQYHIHTSYTEREKKGHTKKGNLCTTSNPSFFCNNDDRRQSSRSSIPSDVAS